MRGRERLLYSPKPALDRFNAGWFAAAGVCLLALGVAIGSWIAAVSVLCFAVAGLSWKRASWTVRRERVLRRRRRRSAGRATLSFEPYPGEPVVPTQEPSR